MSKMSFAQAAHALMNAVARGEHITKCVAHYSGYDVHALQVCMEAVAPEVASLPGFKPLVLWLRESERSQVSSEQNLEDYKSVVELMKCYVNVNQPGDKIYEVQTVGVYVRRDGQYVVTITEKPDALKQEQYAKELVTRLIPCSSAAEMAKVLNPLLLQTDPYSDYMERYRILSPLTLVSEGLHNLCNRRRAELDAKSSELGSVMNTMRVAIQQT